MYSVQCASQAMWGGNTSQGMVMMRMEECSNESMRLINMLLYKTGEPRCRGWWS